MVVGVVGVVVTTVVGATVVGEETAVVAGAVVTGAAVVVGATVVGVAPVVTGGSEKTTPGSAAAAVVVGVAGAAVVCRLVVEVAGRETDVVAGVVVDVDSGTGFSGRAAARRPVDVVGRNAVTAVRPPAAAVMPGPGRPTSRFATLTNATRLTPAARYSSLLALSARVFRYHHSCSRSAVLGRWSAPRFAIPDRNPRHRARRDWGTLAADAGYGTVVVARVVATAVVVGRVVVVGATVVAGAWVVVGATVVVVNRVV